MNHYIDVLTKRYAQFAGRARREEYWMFFLFNVIAIVVLGAIDAMIGLGLLGFVYAVAVFIPGLAVTVRRLHDSGRTGWWALIGLVPFIGFVILLIFMVLDSEPGDNAYGPNPKAAA